MCIILGGKCFIFYMGEINSGIRVLFFCIKLRIVYVCKDGGFFVFSGS